MAAGALRIAYDLGLWAMFVNMKLYTHEGGENDVNEPRRSVDEEEVGIEMRLVEEEGRSSAAR